MGQFGAEDFDSLVSQLMEYLDAGIYCISGSFELIFIVIRTVITIKIQFFQVKLYDYKIYREIYMLQTSLNENDYPKEFEV